jgi:chromosome segregation ATPase
MTDKSASSLELTVGLPLDVVADKLRRLESELRVLNMKAIAATDEANGLGARMESRVEAIYEALDSIRGLVSHIETDVQPKPRSDRDD